MMSPSRLCEGEDRGRRGGAGGPAVVEFDAVPAPCAAAPGPRVQTTGFEDLSHQIRVMLDAIGSVDFFLAHPRRVWQPRVNLYEWPDRYVVCVELAGMPREAIDVRARSGELTIRGSRPKPALPSQPLDVGVHLMEIDSGAFERRINLPPDVDVDGITARYRDGILWIELLRVRT